MNIEFHYYITYLIAVRAGFGTKSSKIIAVSSQYVDDNDMVFTIDKGTNNEYINHISQTMNILKPKKKLFRIYPLFHFIPGDPLIISSRRKDGKLHMLNTTPNSKNANNIMDCALDSKNLYRIGIATHSYVDTWAHQNFIGYYDTFNGMDSGLEKVIPYIGHASAYYYPDWPALIWKDNRLIGKYVKVNNKERYLEATANLFMKYCKYLRPNEDISHIQQESKSLIKDISDSIGLIDQSNENEKERINRYISLSIKDEYGATELEKYEKDIWFDEVVNEQIKGIRDRSVISVEGISVALNRYDPITDIYTWKDKNNYKDSHWYKFQEAVKAHQDNALDILNKKNLSYLNLKEW